MPNFVKFQRGSQTAYNNLSRKDADTLYFIYDSNNAEAGGILYLGDILIGGTGISGVNNLSELSDVDLSNLSTLADNGDGALLQYNRNTQAWEAVLPENLGLKAKVTVGSLQENETVAAAQNRLNISPSEGDIVIINGDSYIYNGITWTSLVPTTLVDRITVLESSVGSLTSSVSTLQTEMAAVDGKITSAIANLDHLTYSVVGSINDIDLNKPNTVFLVPNQNHQVGNLYDEYMVINNQTELLGSFGDIDLSEYVTTSGLTSTLANYITTSGLTSVLSDYITSSNFSSAVNNLTSSINNLQANFDNYVTISRFENEVGNINDLRTATSKLSTNVINELIIAQQNISTVQDDITTLYQMLEWNPINN